MSAVTGWDRVYLLSNCRSLLVLLAGRTESKAKSTTNIDGTCQTTSNKRQLCRLIFSSVLAYFAMYAIIWFMWCNKIHGSLNSSCGTFSYLHNNTTHFAIVTCRWTIAGCRVSLFRRQIRDFSTHKLFRLQTKKRRLAIGYNSLIVIVANHSSPNDTTWQTSLRTSVWFLTSRALVDI